MKIQYVKSPEKLRPSCCESGKINELSDHGHVHERVIETS